MAAPADIAVGVTGNSAAVETCSETSPADQKQYHTFLSTGREVSPARQYLIEKVRAKLERTGSRFSAAAINEHLPMKYYIPMPEFDYYGLAGQYPRGKGSRDYIICGRTWKEVAVAYLDFKNEFVPDRDGSDWFDWSDDLNDIHRDAFSELFEAYELREVRLDAERRYVPELGDIAAERVPSIQKDSPARQGLIEAARAKLSMADVRPPMKFYVFDSNECPDYSPGGRKDRKYPGDKGANDYMFCGRAWEEVAVSFLDFLNEFWPEYHDKAFDYLDDADRVAFKILFEGGFEGGEIPSGCFRPHEYLIEVRPDAERRYVSELRTATKAARV